MRRKSGKKIEIAERQTKQNEEIRESDQRNRVKTAGTATKQKLKKEESTAIATPTTTNEAEIRWKRQRSAKKREDGIYSDSFKKEKTAT